jgi:hypothetical protein
MVPQNIWRYRRGFVQTDVVITGFDCIYNAWPNVRGVEVADLIFTYPNLCRNNERSHSWLHVYCKALTPTDIVTCHQHHGLYDWLHVVYFFYLCSNLFLHLFSLLSTIRPNLSVRPHLCPPLTSHSVCTHPTNKTPSISQHVYLPCDEAQCTWGHAHNVSEAGDIKIGMSQLSFWWKGRKYGLTGARGGGKEHELSKK